jgi:hypothetical protein
VKLLLVGYLALDPAFDEVREQIIRFDYVNGAMEFWSLLADADLNLAVPEAHLGHRLQERDQVARSRR